VDRDLAPAVRGLSVAIELRWMIGLADRAVVWGFVAVGDDLDVVA
jgi:hypothetical protein